MAVSVGYDGLYLDGRRLPIYSGTVHYWRLDRALWAPILDNVKEMGFQVVETYIPWSVHEVVRGHFDFGRRTPEKDLDAFLSLCEEKELYILVRPGPHINSELTYFGYPARVLYDPEVMARTARGTPAVLPVPPKHFPIPSYASEKFYQEVAVWLDAVCPIIARHVYPRGRVIAIQSDNEMSFFFRLEPYDLDYAPGSIRLYQAFLRERYGGDLSALNETYGTDYADWDQIEPPREFRGERKEDLPWYMDWVVYKEYYLIYGLDRVQQMFKERGITDIPVFHNYPTAYPTTPFHLPWTEEKLDIQGIDIYPHKEDYEYVKLGVEYTAHTSRMPFIPEFGSGVWFWFKALLPEDERFTTLTNFMHGLKAINYYMIVERERWTGSPITRDNRRREPYFQFYQRLNRMLHEHDLASFRKRSDILLLANRDYDRLEAAVQLVSPPSMWFSGLPGLSRALLASDDDLGLGDVIQAEKDVWFQTMFKALALAQYAYGVSEVALSLDELKRYPAVLVATFAFMDTAEQEKLVAYAQAGGTLIIGPRAPRLDARMRPAVVLGEHLAQPVGRLAEAVVQDVPLRAVDLFDEEPLLSVEGKAAAYVRPLGQGRIVHLGFLPPAPVTPQSVATFARLLDGLLARLGLEKPVTSDDPTIDVTLHEHEGRRIVFAANPSDEAKKSIIRLAGAREWKDLWTGEALSGQDGAISVAIEPWTVKVWEVA